MRKNKESKILLSIKEIIINARQLAFKNTNSVLLHMYWNIGRLIVDDQQYGKSRAGYGKETLRTLSQHLTIEFGKGFDERNLSNMRAFYQAFPIWYAVRTELSWTHYRLLCRIENQSLRMSYVQYAINENWNTRALERNIRTSYVHRIIKTSDTGHPLVNELVKDPYIFEFLGMHSGITETENNIESALIRHLQQFLIELGKGFAFVAKQQHITTDTSDFYIDLVFYNYHLKCFVLIDLKTEKLDHAAIGQMDMYIRLYDDLKRSENDNPTMGIILCTEKDETIVKYSVMADHRNLFASKYRLYLPQEEELARLIDSGRINFELDRQVPDFK